jgi:hypothetical protein
MITIGLARSRTVPAQVAYCPPSPILMLPAKMTLGILGGIADVEDLSARISHPYEDFVEIDGMETCSRFLSSVARSRVLRMAS